MSSMKKMDDRLKDSKKTPSANFDGFISDGHIINPVLEQVFRTEFLQLPSPLLIYFA